MAKQAKSEEPIRPALKVAAAFFVGTAILAVWAVVTAESGPRRPDGAGARREAAVDPPAEQWTGWQGGSAEAMPIGDEEPLSPGARAIGAGLEQRDRDDDQQILAMNVSHGAVGDAGIAPAFYPVTRRGRLSSATGDLPVGAGASCEVRVLPVRTRGPFNCLIKVECDGVVIYPEPELHAGYVSCDVARGVPARAVDDGVTDEDGDPTVDYDLRGAKVVVSDSRPDGRSFVAEVVMDPLPPLCRL